MCRLLETIKILNNKPCNLFYHNLRMKKSRSELFQINDDINLENIINLPDNSSKLLKCRIIYDKNIIKIDYIPYIFKVIKTLKIIYSNTIEYNYKFEDRQQLTNLLNQKEQCDDILIIKNKRITDTSFTNILFYNENKWITPSAPLLKGTKREKLLLENKILEDDIVLSDLKYFKKACLINSMLDIEDRVFIDIKSII